MKVSNLRCGSLFVFWFISTVSLLYLETFSARNQAKNYRDFTIPHVSETQSLEMFHQSCESELFSSKIWNSKGDRTQSRDSNLLGSMFCAVGPDQRKTSVSSDIRRNIIRFSDPAYSCVGGLGDPAPAPDGNIFVRRTINRSKWTDCTAGRPRISSSSSLLGPRTGRLQLLD